jgi:hypothetical protein
MTEPQNDADQPEETVRQHSQDPAEGPDPDAEDGDDEPRVHTQDPAEG